MRASDKIRIAVNEAFYTHLSNRKGLYTNESLVGVSLHISHCATVTGLVSAGVQIRNRDTGTALW